MPNTRTPYCPSGLNPPTANTTSIARTTTSAIEFAAVVGRGNASREI
jgi:hypothetical protein